MTDYILPAVLIN